MAKNNLNLPLIKKLGFRKCTKFENRNSDALFVNEQLELWIYRGHSMNQVIRNYLQTLVQSNDKGVDLGKYLDKIYSFKA